MCVCQGHRYLFTDFNQYQLFGVCVQFKGLEGLTVTERERGQWDVCYTSSQNLCYRFLNRWQFWGLLMDFDWLVYSIEYLNGSITNCNLQNG